MQWIVQSLMRLLPRPREEGAASDGTLRDKSYDRALASFKADLETRAAKNTRYVPGEWQSRRS